jgi:hypothetical protein
MPWYFEKIPQCPECKEELDVVDECLWCESCERLYNVCEKCLDVHFCRFVGVIGDPKVYGNNPHLEHQDCDFSSKEFERCDLMLDDDDFSSLYYVSKKDTDYYEGEITDSCAFRWYCRVCGDTIWTSPD